MAINGGGWPGASGSSEVNFWRERELRRLWRETCEGCGLCQWISTPSGWTVAVPAIRQVTLGNPTVMTIHLRTDQRASSIEAVAARITDDMGIGGLRVIPFRDKWVYVELLAPTKPDTRVTPPTPPVRSTRRTNPSKAWTNRWHARRLRRPGQPS
jgi:hypothetical protein